MRIPGLQGPRRGSGFAEIGTRPARLAAFVMVSALFPPAARPCIPPPPSQPPRRRPRAPKEARLRKEKEEAGWAWSRGDQALLLKKVLALAGHARKKGPFLFLLAGIKGSRGPCFHGRSSLELCGKFLSWFPPAQETAWRNFLEDLPPSLARDLPPAPSLARDLARGWREDLSAGKTLLWAADRKTLEKDAALMARRVETLEREVRSSRKKIALHEKKEKAWERRLREEWKPRRGRIQGWSGDWIADHIRMHREAAEKERKRIRSWEKKKAALARRIGAIRDKLEEYGERRAGKASQGPSSSARTDQRSEPSPSNRWIRSPALSRRKSPPSPSRSRAAGAKTLPSSFPEGRISPRNQPDGLKRRRAGCSFHWATTMFPSGRTPTATGRDLSPGLGQVENIIWKVPSRKKTWTHWLKVSAT